MVCRISTRTSDNPVDKTPRPTERDKTQADEQPRRNLERAAFERRANKLDLTAGARSGAVDYAEREEHGEAGAGHQAVQPWQPWDDQQESKCGCSGECPEEERRLPGGEQDNAHRGEESQNDPGGERPAFTPTARHKNGS